MNVRALPKYAEGGNLLALVLLPIAALVAGYYYGPIAQRVGSLNIDTQILYSYVLNLFAIEFGALLTLFALLACRPTQYLDRIKNTSAFKSLFSNIKITLGFAAACILYSFVLGIFKLEPAKHLDLPTILFLAWLLLSIGVTMFYARSIRLTFLALT